MPEKMNLNVYAMYYRHVYQQDATKSYTSLFIALEDSIDDAPEMFMRLSREFPSAAWCVDQFHRGNMEEVAKKAKDEGNHDKY